MVVCNGHSYNICHHLSLLFPFVSGNLPAMQDARMHFHNTVQ